jgi:membrane protein DedA with SNARE-associated domain
MEEHIALITLFAEKYGIFFIVPLVLLENIPIIGLVAPGVSVLVLAGFFSSVLPGGPVTTFILIYSTMVIADTFWYFLGLKYGTKLAWLQYIKDKGPHIEQAITDHPVHFLMFYQFVPYLRMFLPFSLGVYSLSPTKWFKVTIPGSFMFTSAYFGVGIAISFWYESIDETERLLGLIPVIALIISVVFSSKIINKYLKNKRLAKEKGLEES